MAFSGVDAVVLGVADLGAARRFLADCGLREVFAAPDRLVCETRDGGEVVVRPADAPDLAPAPTPGAVLREVIWGVADAAALKRALTRLGAADALVAGPDGLPRALDPAGFRLAFRVSRRRPVKVAPMPANAPGNPGRIDRRAAASPGIEPVRIGHLGLCGGDLAAMRAFYTEAMGFLVSDEAPGHAAFLRCRRRGTHHDLLLLGRDGPAGLDHLGLTLVDAREVIGAGRAMAGAGWQSAAGPGPLDVSSAWAWRFASPLGPVVEFHADDDYCTEAWEPGHVAPGAEAAFAWTLPARPPEPEDG
jgi:catechol 2,3-dioxygenase-like lactoylglutathione lyase family enzyme